MLGLLHKKGIREQIILKLALIALWLELFMVVVGKRKF